MDTVTAGTVIAEVYKAAGVVGLLLLLLVAVVYLGYRDSRARERANVEALEKCRQQHVESTKTTTAALANNTNAMHELCQVMRDRPCLKDLTPAKGQNVPHL